MPRRRRARQGLARARAPAAGHRRAVIAKTEADAWPDHLDRASPATASRLEVSDYASRQIRPRLQTLPGRRPTCASSASASPRCASGSTAQARRLQLTPLDVEDAIRRQNVEIPAGRIESRAREFAVLSQTDLATPEQFGAA
jgi:multidrug efflux pump